MNMPMNTYPSPPPPPPPYGYPHPMAPHMMNRMNPSYPPYNSGAYNPQLMQHMPFLNNAVRPPLPVSPPLPSSPPPEEEEDIPLPDSDEELEQLDTSLVHESNLDPNTNNMMTTSNQQVPSPSTNGPHPITGPTLKNNTAVTAPKVMPQPLSAAQFMALHSRTVKNGAKNSSSAVPLHNKLSTAVITSANYIPDVSATESFLASLDVQTSRQNKKRKVTSHLQRALDSIRRSGSSGEYPFSDVAPTRGVKPVFIPASMRKKRRVTKKASPKTIVPTPPATSDGTESPYTSIKKPQRHSVEAEAVIPNANMYEAVNLPQTVKEEIQNMPHSVFESDEADVVYDETDQSNSTLTRTKPSALASLVSAYDSD